MSRISILAFILLFALGADQAYQRFFSPRATSSPLRIPFARFPMDFPGPGWEGKDVPLMAETERIAMVTDYIQRTYTRGSREVWFYVGYVQGWTPTAVHHPGICFPLRGLILQREEVVTINVPGITAPLRFNETLWQQELGGSFYTLSTFYYRGKFEPSENQLRLDRFLGIDYFAIITVSGTFTGSQNRDREIYFDLIRKAVPELLNHFPN